MSKYPLLFIVPAVFLWCCNAPIVKKAHEQPALYLPDDLQATLWAETPMFHNPTNMDIDARGRVWVTEAVNYRNFNNDSTKALHHSLGDRVMIIEDTNSDGRADRSKLFVQDQDLVSPLGIGVIGNKIYVSCSPNLIVYTDADDDDKPDSKEIFLTGFGGKDHDHSLHALVGGPDGNFYFNAGNAGPHIVKDKAGWNLRSGSLYTGGSPTNLSNQGNMKSDDGQVWVGGLALRINNEGKGLKVIGHNFRNAYELAIDSKGDMWQNDNDDQVLTCRATWLMEGGNAGYFSSDGTRAWEADQRPGQDIFTAHWHQDDPGVMPAGDNTGAGSPTGVVVNEGDALGEKYRGMMLSADAGRNMIFAYHPQKKMSGYDLGKRLNLISSLKEDNADYVWNDSTNNSDHMKWFRPSDVAIGADGAIYVADWYDPVVGGHQMKDSLGYGRIYRITPKDKPLAQPKIDLSTMEGQLEALKSPAVNVRYLAFQKLKARGDNAAASVSTLLQDKNPYHQARAIWLLSQLGKKGKLLVENLLRDKDENKRVVAFRALRQASDNILPYAAELSHDPSAFVRREAAISLQGLPFSKTKPILIELIKHFDGEDRWYLESLGYAIQGHEAEMYDEIIAMADEDHRRSPNWDKRTAALAWRLHAPNAVNDLKERATTETVSAPERSKAITALAFINTPGAAKTMSELSKNKLSDVADQSTYWLGFRHSNNWFSLLNWKQTGIDPEYERKLAMMKVIKSKMLDERLPLDERKYDAIKMAKDSIGGQLIIGLATEKKLPPALYSFVEDNIFNNPNQAVRIQASLYFKKPGDSISYSIPEISKLPHNAVAGEKVFAENCANCHRVNKNGKDIGPELTAIAKKFDRQGLLDVIVNPSAGIVFGYEPWTISTKNGESYFGFLVADGEKTIVIKDIAGKQHVIPSSSISRRQKQAKSLMPEPSALGIKEQQLADVVEYLMNIQ